MTEYKNVRAEKKDGVLVVTIDRERALNALNRETIAELQQLFSYHWTDDSVGCVILTGAGPKAFVAGADITALADADLRAGAEISANGLYLMKTIQNFPRPVIAAVNGFALGGRRDITKKSDIRLASKRPSSGSPRSIWGSFPAMAVRSACRVWLAGARQCNSF